MIACPNCGTRYQVAYAAIGPKGRNVLCAHCGRSWQAHAEPPPKPEAKPKAKQRPELVPIDKDFGSLAEELLDEKFVIEEQRHKARREASLKADEEEQAALLKARRDAQTASMARVTERAAVSDAAGTGAALLEGDADELPLHLDAHELAAFRSEEHQKTVDEIRAVVEAGPSAEAVDPVVHRRRQQEFSKRQRTLHSKLPVARIRRMARMAALGAIVGLFGVGLLLRGPIVQQFPQLAGAYAALGLEVNVIGLEFRDVHTLQSLQGGTEVLVVDGKIASVAAHEVKMPQVIVTLLGHNGAPVYEWSMTPKAGELEPGETVPFETQIGKPPDGATEVKLTFSNGRTGSRPADAQAADADAPGGPDGSRDATTTDSAAPVLMVDSTVGANAATAHQPNDGKADNGQNPAR
ncbi:MAG: DUF3426 domain-containing protein [Devosia sp.]|nr:DUF3426 domain-containing protein [Devosia sp.]